ncbi:MAG: exosortase [Acidobacteriales bacterium]|nr:exosortase [Terriglobales bacterium]
MPVDSTNLSAILDRRHVLWIAALAALAVIFSQTLIGLGTLSLSVNYYSHLVVVPFLSGFLLYRYRNKIFSNTAPALPLAGLVALIAVPLLIFSPDPAAPGNTFLFARGLALFTLVVAAFVACYGAKALRAAVFPLFLLLLAVPLPISVVERVIVFLQKGSAEVSNVLFAMTGIAYFRQGDVFHLPNVTIEIAQECSGIRSSIGLLITTLLAVHFFMRSRWKQALVVACVVPLVLLKNGLRIVTLSLLAVYVDPGFLSGWLHTSGGIVFYLLTLALIGILIRILERRPAISQPVASARAAY